MSELIDRSTLGREIPLKVCLPCPMGEDFECKDCLLDKAMGIIEAAPTIDAVPVKFIDEVIEYLTKCRDHAIHEETKTAWDEQRQTLIMILHEWDAWNECGRTGKYGEWKEE